MDAERVWEIFIAIILSVSGGMVRILNKAGAVKMQWKWIALEIFTSAFTGYMALLMANLLGLTGNWVGLICGMAGLMGIKMLNIISIFVEKSLISFVNKVGQTKQK